MKKIFCWQTLAAVGLLMILFAGCSRLAYAGTPNIIIDALAWGDPGADDEFVRLKNNGPDAVDMSKWSVQVKSADTTTVQKKNFTSGAVVGPGASYTIANSGGRFALQANMTYASLSLPAKQTTVVIAATTTALASFDDPAVVASYVYNAASSTIATTSTTNTSPAPATTSAAISAVPENFGVIFQKENWTLQLNELLPRTTGDEFIEIINNSSDGADVLGLRLRDASGATYVLGSTRENTVLGAHEARAWPRSRTRIALNDTGGELVQLIDHNGSVIDQVVYPSDAPREASFSRVFGTWEWSTRPTPAQENIFAPLPAPPVARAEIPAGPFMVGENFFVSALDTTDPNDNIKNFLWNFGDGFEIDTVTSTHSYERAGDFVVRFTVIDSLGASSTVARTIHVTDGTPTTPSVVIPPATSHTQTVGADISAATLEIAARRPESAFGALNGIAPKKNSPGAYTGMVVLPPGIIGTRRFVVDDYLVETTTALPILAKLTRGTVISFSGNTQLSAGVKLVKITKKNFLRIIKNTTPPPLATIAGVVGRVETTSYGLIPKTGPVIMILKSTLTKLPSVKEGDKISLTGIFLYRADASPIFVPIGQTINAPAGPNGLPQNNYSGILLLIASGVVLVIIQILITHYGKNFYHPPHSSNWLNRLAKFRAQAQSTNHNAQNRLRNFAYRIIAWRPRRFGGNINVNRKN